MIAYETLVQAIEDWRAGKRPAALNVSASSRAPLATDDGYDELELDEAADDADPYAGDISYVDEGTDDFAIFDPINDIHSYFTAEAQIEQAWVDPQARYDLFSEYGIRDEAHFSQVKASIERFLESPVGQARWGGMEVAYRLRGSLRPGSGEESRPNLLPVDGVTVQHWAYAQAQIAVGYDPTAVLAQLGIDETLWSRAALEWNSRMSDDATGTIANEYAQAYAQAQEQVASVSDASLESVSSDDPPMSFERWVEVEQACQVLSTAGHELPDILAEFDTEVEVWDAATTWWQRYMEEHGHENGQALLGRYHQLQDYYRAHYAQALGE